MLRIDQTVIVQINHTAEHVEDRDCDLFLVFPDKFRKRLVAACAPDKLPLASLELGTRSRSSL